MVFISHSSVDHSFVLQLIELLKKNNIGYWVAPESIDRGDDFVVEITNALNYCEIFLIVLTKDAMESPHVRRELEIAIDKKKTILPLKIGDFEIDDIYRYLLSNVQYPDFDFNNHDQVDDLVGRLKLGEKVVTIEITKNPRRMITIIKGGFEENMDYMIQNYPEELDSTLFAMGIDASSRLDISTEKGILKSVCSYLFEKYKISLDDLQPLVDNAKVEQLGHKSLKQEFKYKDSIIIHVPINHNDKVLALNLLLIANSSKKVNAIDNEDINGIDSREIIISVFNRVSKLEKGYKNLFIGAMGTNGLKFPYQVASSELVNCFVYSITQNSYPHHLYFSTRREDMQKYGIDMDDILLYISRVARFVKI